MTHVTCRLTVKNRDQLRNPTLGNRVWATFTFFTVADWMADRLSVFATWPTLPAASISKYRQRRLVWATFTFFKVSVLDPVRSAPIVISLSYASRAFKIHTFALLIQQMCGFQVDFADKIGCHGNVP